MPEKTTTDLARAYLLRQKIWPGFTLLMDWQTIRELAEKEIQGQD